MIPKIKRPATMDYTRLKSQKVDQITVNEKTILKFEDIANIPKLANQIVCYLNSRDLATCRLVSKKFKDLIDNNKLWWINQINFMRRCPTNFVLCSKTYKIESRVFTGLIETQFPEWALVNECFINETSTERIQRFVLYMWSYFNDHKKGFKDPLDYAVQHGEVEFLKLLKNSPFNFDVRLLNDILPTHYFGWKNRLKSMNCLQKSKESNNQVSE